jgi:hypothetical protein
MVDFGKRPDCVVILAFDMSMLFFLWTILGPILLVVALVVALVIHLGNVSISFPRWFNSYWHAQFIAVSKWVISAIADYIHLDQDEAIMPRVVERLDPVIVDNFAYFLRELEKWKCRSTP